MKALLWVIFFIFTSCATTWERRKEPANSLREFIYKDMTGDFNVLLEKKRDKNRVISKSILFAGLDKDSPLEKTISVSKIGVLKFKSGTRPSMRPDISQHSIWFEKQKYFSQVKVDGARKKLVVTMVSPDKDWNGVKEFNFPKGSIFCFFTQLPECLKVHGLLKIGKKKIPIMLIWNSYPYHTEQYRDVRAEPFQAAQVYIERVGNLGTQVGVNLGNQMILYDYDRDGTFIKMFWIAQGITMTSSDNLEKNFGN